MASSPGLSRRSRSQTLCPDSRDARDPPPLAWRASAGRSPPKRISAKAGKRGHDDREHFISMLKSRVPVEPALAPVGLAKFVGHFDRLDPFRVLVTELGRGAQPQRITERIADDLAGIFGREDS